jgi:mannan endo-1,4-beta-mannosidase
MKGWDVMRIPVLPLVLAAALVAATGVMGGDSSAMRSTMYVQGRYLYDPCGEKVILRGFNAMILVSDRKGEATYPEIAKTGANCCRIFWKVDGAPAEELEKTIANCRSSKMIPIPCVWDASGKKWENFSKCVDFWCRPDISAILRKHQDCLILNIANEVGTNTLSDEEYRRMYTGAVRRLRETGLRAPLMIDAADMGKGEDYLLHNAQPLLEKDPDHNLLFSWHPWIVQRLPARCQKAVDGSIEKDFCLVIGEFSQLSALFETPLDYHCLLQYSEEKQIGWLPWTWWCRGKGDRGYDGHSVTRDRKFGHWANQPWGEEIAISGPYSVQKTAKRSYYLEHGTAAPDKSPGSNLKSAP